MALKFARFHVEPMWYYEGKLVKPDFGRPDQYMDKIVEWVKRCPCPQTYGTYTLWKVMHQQKRIDALEGMVKLMMLEIIKLQNQMADTTVFATEVKSDC
jgi:hypothetical protein